MSAFAQTAAAANISAHGTTSMVLEPADFRREFVCPEESMRYAGSLVQLVFGKLRDSAKQPVVVEFGSGTGEPVISAILNSQFSGVVHGYEVNAEASETADRLIEEYGLAKKYIVHHASFFETNHIPAADYLIANPPYVPCRDRTLLTLPDLCGGEDGNTVSKNLLSSGYKNVFLEVSSYSDPEDLVRHAHDEGYKITDFLLTPMTLGVYSRQDIVQERLNEMRAEGKAFFTRTSYFVGSAFFTKEETNEPDLSSDFLACLTAAGRQNQKVLRPA